MTIADRIKYQREKQGLSQETLANKIGLKDKSSIAKIEKSGNKITLKHVEKISEALGCSIPYLMGWEDEEYKGKDIVDVESFVAETPAYGATKANQPLTDKEKHFIECYSKLSEEQKMLVDSLMSSWLSKQESDPV